MSQFDRHEILPEDPDLEVLHDREYRVRAFRKGDNLLIRGAIRDQKPPDLYFPEDDDPLTIHHMQVEIEVAFPSLEIIGAAVVFETHPHHVCSTISTHYEKLIGLSIARGFTHKVRELFGGPRGCTHTTALLQAMAPVAVQCFWSMTASNSNRQDHDPSTASAVTPEQRATGWRMNINTCHVWAEDGDLVERVRTGVDVPIPLPVQRRAAELGVDAGDFIKRARG